VQVERMRPTNTTDGPRGHRELDDFVTREWDDHLAWEQRSRCIAGHDLEQDGRTRWLEARAVDEERACGLFCAHRDLESAREKVDI
jgi:hypothetical protein